MSNRTGEKCPFMDTVWGFALKLFGILCFANVLSQIFAFIAGVLSELIGDLTAEILIDGMGIMICVTAVYQVAWNKGFRDIGLVSRDVITYRKHTGLIAGLIASIPGLLLYIVLLIMSGSEQTFPIGLFFYKLINAYAFLIVDRLANAGIIGLISCIIFLLPVPLAAWMGYIWGYRNKLVSKSLMYGKNDTKNSQL